VYPPVPVVPPPMPPPPFQLCTKSHNTVAAIATMIVSTLHKSKVVLLMANKNKTETTYLLERGLLRGVVARPIRRTQLYLRDKAKSDTCCNLSAVPTYIALPIAKNP